MVELKALGRLLQIDGLTWATIEFQHLRGRTLTVLFAWGIMAWNRFGLLSFAAPRAPLRLILVGVYSWLGLAAAVWVASSLAGSAIVRMRDAAVATAIVHVPLVALGFFVAIVAGFARILGPGTVVAVFVFALWMPALLYRAFREVAGLERSYAAATAVVVHLAWLAGPGNLLRTQVGHLL